MTPAEMTRAERLAQGLPPVVTDKATLAFLATVCRKAQNAKPERRRAA